jgi:adenine-specific DNA-methyltransferase
MSREEYDNETGAIDEEGNKLFLNTTTNGRFHSDWLSMMYERIVIARDLLRDDGVIFISIDDNEVANLRKIGDEIFGEENFVANVVWQKKYAATNDAKGFSNLHDHIIVYQKSFNFDRLLLPRTDEQNKPYKNDDGDGKGLWRSDNLLVRSFSESGVYPIKNPNTGQEFYPPQGSCWRASKKTMKIWLAENRIFFGKDGKGAPQLKRYLNEVQQGRVPNTWWTFQEVGHNDAANKELKALFNTKAPFDTPKPTSLIRQMLLVSANKKDIILDFFSGSATTAHAVMQLNAEDGGNRKFIMVQLPEPTAEDSEAFKAGYGNISEIGKERIRRAAKKIQEDNTDKDLSNIDFGFRVFKLDSSNMKDVYYNPNEIDQRTLTNLKDNIKEDRSDKDLLYQVLLEMAVPISANVNEETVGNKTIYRVNDNFLIACFDDEVDLETVTKIAEFNPLRIVFKDSSFKDDAAKVNCDEYLKNKSPNTIVKVI